MRKDYMVEDNLVIEGARIGFRNFAGKEGKFNPAGQRNFCVFLEPEDGANLEKIGWNIKWLDPREEGDVETPYLPVAVNYKNIPPNILLISGQGKNRLSEAEVDILDWAEIKNVDIVIKPYNWEVNGKRGVKAYVKSMYVTIIEDEFAEKYYDVPDSGDEIPFED